MQPYKAVLFDLDGTLLNTLDDLTDSVNTILQQHGFPLRDAPEIRSFLGNGADAVLPASLPEDIRHITSSIWKTKPDHTKVFGSFWIPSARQE